MGSKKCFYVVLLVVLITAHPGTPAQAQGTGVISLFVDSLKTDVITNPNLYSPFDFYVIIQPGSDGLYTAEYRLELPSSIYEYSYTPNPAIPLISETGNIFEPGIRSEYGGCQRGWFWAQKITCLTFSTEPAFIWVVPHDESGIRGAESCSEPDRLIEDYLSPSPLCVNNWEYYHVRPTLNLVEASSPTSVYAEFSQRVVTWNSMFYNDLFFIYDSSNIQDTIRVYKAWQEGYEAPNFTLALVSPMVPGTDYVLVANDICCVGHGCASSSMYFHYDGNFEDKPDLWPIDMTSETFSPSACESFQAGYSVNNMGSLPAGPFSVRGIVSYYTDGARIQETIFMKEYPGLDAGSTLKDSLEISVPDNFSLHTYVGIHVDYYDEVDEWTDYNNYWTLDFFNYNPVIVSVEDLPEDAGGWLTLFFNSSRFESLNEDISVRYDILRRIDDSEVWDVVGQVPGSGTNTYQCNVPTAADSGDGEQTNWSVYRVSLIVPDGVPPEETQIYTSCPDSGYSLDNSISTLLQAHSAMLDDSRVLLTWKLSNKGSSGIFTVDRSENGSRFIRIADPDIEGRGGEYRFLDDTVLPGRSYRYRVGYIDKESGIVLFETQAIQIPGADLALYQNSPNPFNPSTTISWLLPDAMRVRLEIFDVSGRSVYLLLDKKLESGRHSTRWDGIGSKGSPLSSGIYFLRLSAGKESITRKMVLLK